MKNQLINNFDKATNYLDNRGLHKQVEIDLLKSAIPHFKKGGMVACELGCADKVALNSLSRYYKKVIGIDISNGQLKRVRELLNREEKEKNNTIYLKNIDINDYRPTPGSISCFFSCMTLHWLANINESLTRLFHGLERGGVMAVAFPISGSLDEARKYLVDKYNFIAFNQFPSLRELSLYQPSLYLSTPTISIGVKDYYEEYENWHQLFRYFSALGAQTRLSPERNCQLPKFRQRATILKRIINNEKNQSAVKLRWRIVQIISIKN